MTRFAVRGPAEVPGAARARSASRWFMPRPRRPTAPACKAVRRVTRGCLRGRLEGGIAILLEGVHPPILEACPLWYPRTAAAAITYPRRLVGQAVPDANGQDRRQAQPDLPTGVSHYLSA